MPIESVSGANPHVVHPTPSAAQTLQAPSRTSTAAEPDAAFAGLGRRRLPDSEDHRARVREPSSLAAYLLTRRLDDRAVDTDGIARLIPADKAMSDARQVLSFGRGNVDVDARKTDLESGARALAAKQLRNDGYSAGLQLAADDETNWRMHSAMSAYIFGAGNCGEHASIAGFSYGAHAQEHHRPSDERVQLVRLKGLDEDHVWAEAHSRVPGQSPVVMDAWADGPVVFAEDSRFAKNRLAVESPASFSVSGAAEADEIVRATAKSALLHKKDRLAQRLSQGWEKVAPLAGGNMETKGYRPPEQVLDRAFAARVRLRLESNDPRETARVKLEAAQVAALLKGLGATPLEPSRIIDEAKALVVASSSS